MIPHLYGLPTAGDRVGDYRIVGLLGEGGHGHVYRAEAFGRSFAVKFMDPGLEAFGKREVQALMQLNHPGVVRFLGCGRWRDPERGLFYVVMELVEGLTLYDSLREYNPTARKVGEMMLTLGRTLLAVEEAGVLHRDVKRENIVVRLPSQSRWCWTSGCRR